MGNREKGDFIDWALEQKDFSGKPKIKLIEKILGVHLANGSPELAEKMMLAHFKKGDAPFRKLAKKIFEHCVQEKNSKQPI